ncbi:MAG: hypothetical protein ACTHOE_09130 [Conexibacter sp.]
MKLCKLLLAAVGATVLLGALVSTASATRLESSSQTLRTAFTSVRFRETFGSTTDCAVTLEGSLHSRTIQKVAGTLIGYITRADLGPCAGTGTATILTETLPWHVRYLAFSGTLPNITRLIINVIGSAFRVRFPTGSNCLARSTPEEPAIGTFERDITTRELTAAEIGGRIRTSCLNISGTFESSRNRPTVLGGTAGITVTLI